MAGERESSHLPVPDPTLLTTAALQHAVAAERDYVDGQIAVGRERLAALDRLVQTQFHDRDIAVSQSTAQINDSIERVNDRLGLLVDAQGQMMPRAEAKLLIDALGARIETMQKGLGQLSEVIASLRSSLSGQSSGQQAAEARADRNRNLTFAVLGVSVAVIGLVIGLFLR